MFRRFRNVSLLISALVTLSGCFELDFSGLDSGGGYGGGSWTNTCDGPPGTIESVTLTSVPYAYHTQLGDSVRISAYIQDGACKEVVIDLMKAWSSSAPDVATIAPQLPAGKAAIARTHALGSARIWLRINGILGETWVHVVPRVAQLRINPAASTLKLGDSVFVSATAIGTDGRVLTGIPIAMVAAFTDVIDTRINSAGVWAFGRKVGVTTVHASVFQHSETSTITVVAP